MGEAIDRNAGRPGLRDCEALVEAEARLFEALDLDVRSRFVRLKGAPVEVARVLEVGDAVGDAPALLFVHGAGATAAFWAPLLTQPPHVRGICVDLPGCGLTDPFDHRGVDLREHGPALLTSVMAALDLDAVPIKDRALPLVIYECLHHTADMHATINRMMYLAFDPTRLVP
jgi:pimeloyl-ACP methyl ester carboxylesterase